MEITETIEALKGKSEKVKKDIKEKTLKLSEHMDNAECVELDEDEALICMIDNTTSKIKSKMRK